MATAASSASGASGFVGLPPLPPPVVGSRAGALECDADECVRWLALYEVLPNIPPAPGFGMTAVAVGLTTWWIGGGGEVGGTDVGATVGVAVFLGFGVGDGVSCGAVVAVGGIVVAVGVLVGIGVAVGIGVFVGVGVGGTGGGPIGVGIVP